jgi:hypothetical protein
VPGGGEYVVHRGSSTAWPQPAESAQAPSPGPGAVLPQSPQRRNPDASRASSGRGRRAVGVRAQGAPPTSAGSSGLHGERNGGGPPPNTPRRSSDALDRTNGRGGPGCGREHRETAGGSSKSVPPTPKGWTGTARRPILAADSMHFLQARRFHRRPGRFNARVSTFFRCWASSTAWAFPAHPARLVAANRYPRWKPQGVLSGLRLRLKPLRTPVRVHDAGSSACTYVAGFTRFSVTADTPHLPHPSGRSSA